MDVRRGGGLQLSHPCCGAAYYAEDCENQQCEEDHEFDAEDVGEFRVDY